MNALVIVLSILVIVWIALYLSALKKIKSFEAKKDFNPAVDVFNSEFKKESDILRLLSISEKLLLTKSDGRGIISQAKNVFKSYIDPDFENWGLNKKSEATIETEIQVYEMAKDATFKDMFISLSDNLDVLCLTQSQIISFCEKHSGYLRTDGYGTFFLTKKDFAKPATEDNLFVVGVDVSSDGLGVHVDLFGRARVWDAVCRHRLVVPKLS